VKTNISKNAILGHGESFGKTDLNILSGISVDKAVETMLKGIILREPDFIVGRTLY
jgi:hypothetical protein